MSEITRNTIVADKIEITEEEVNQLIELKHEYPDMTGLKKYTDKKYRDLSEEEKKELVENLLTDDYLKYKNCFIARSKLLYDTSETLEKEISILDKLNELGYVIYLLPYQYARDSMNCYQKSADSISLGNFLEFKTVTSTGKNAGQSAFRDGKKQANNIFITLKNETSEEKVINNIYATIREAKNNKNEIDYSGLLYLNFEKLDNKTVLYELDKDGYAVRLQSADFDYFKKIKGIVSDSQVLENPITEYGSSPEKNINEQNLSVNSVNKTISGNLKFENADPENSRTDESGSLDKLNEFAKSSGYELHPDSIYEKEDLVLSHEQSIDANKDLFNKEEFLTGMLNNILAAVDEDKIFNKYYTKKDFIETYIKNDEDNVETVEDLAGELLAYSVLGAGLNIYDDTWNYLLNITDNIYPAVYVASQDAFLGDTLRFFIDNADGTQWDKLRENKFYVDGVLKNALESIMNDSEFTVNPTLELAEKIEKLPEALEYLNNLKETYSKDYSDTEQYKAMVESIDKYFQKYMKEKFVRLTPAGFKKWIEENEHLNISKEQSLALLKSLDGNYREVGLVDNKLIYWQSEPATDEYHPTTLEELCNMQLEVEMNMHHDNMDNFLSEITEIAKKNNFKSITDKIEDYNWQEASLEPLDYSKYVNKHLPPLAVQFNSKEISELISYNEQAGDKMLYDKEHDKLYRLTEYDVPNYEKTHNTDLLNESDLLEMLSFSAIEAEDGNIGRTEDDPMIKVNNEACNFFREKAEEINVDNIADSFLKSLTYSSKDDFYSPDEEHECRFYCEFNPTVLGFTDSLESEDTTYRVGMVFNKGQECVDYFIDRINNSSTIDYDVQDELGGNFKDAFSLAEDHVRRWFIEKNPKEFPIVVDYAFPEKQHGITSYEEPRWNFTDKNQILEIIKNNSPNVYNELMRIIKENPNETFNFDLGKSLVYSDNWVVGDDTRDFSKETLEEKLDDIYQFRYWNNYDDNHADINDFEEPIELVLKDKELVSKLNELIESHVQKNIENWDVYKEKRSDYVINQLRGDQLHIHDSGEKGSLRLQTFTLDPEFEDALDLKYCNGYMIDGELYPSNFWLEADYEIQEGNVRFTSKEPVIKVHEYIDINQHEEEKSVHELSYYVSEDLQKKIAYEFDAKMVEETILPDLGLTRVDFAEYDNLFKDTITSDAYVDGNLWRVFAEVHREWANAKSPKGKIEKTISQMLYDSIDNNLYKTYKLGEDDGKMLRFECCDEIASHIISGEIKDWETIQKKADLFCKDWVMKNELKNDIPVNTIFGHSVPERNEIVSEIKKHTFIYKMDNEIAKSFGLELESSENTNIKYTYEIRGTYSGQYNSDKLLFDNPEFDFVSLATDYSGDKEYGKPLEDKTAVYPLDDYKSIFGEQTVTEIKDSISKKAAELTGSLRIFKLSKGEEVHFSSEELEPVQVEDIQLFFAKKVKNNKYPSRECVIEIIRMTDEYDADLNVDPAGRICMNVVDGIKTFNSADELGEAILKFFDNQIENGNLEPSELMEETQFSHELQELVNDIQNEKRKTELDYSDNSNNIIESYLNKVKQNLTVKDRKTVDKVLIASQKALSNFSKDEKAVIGQFLLDSGVVSQDKLGKIISKKVIEHDKQNIKSKKHDTSYGIDG